MNNTATNFTFETGVGKTEVVDLPVIQDYRGNLAVIESGKSLPFPINRVYYLYDIPTSAYRGGHAHRALHQLLISISGSFDVLTDNGTLNRTFSLNKASVGLYIGPYVWRDLRNFSSNAVCLVLASMVYDESDYIRDFAEFKESIPDERPHSVP